MAYPTSLDSFTNPTASDTLASPVHHTQHANDNDAIVAIETKVGIGASTPVAGSALASTTAGSSAWNTIPGQVYPFPASVSGDSDQMTATTNWADVTAFDTKEILGSTLLHLKTLGASKDQRVRFTLGTTKAAVFDFRFHGIMFDGQYWSAGFDTYVEFALSTSGGTVVAIARYYPVSTASGELIGLRRWRFGTTAVVTTNDAATLDNTSICALRIARDGSNLLSFSVGQGSLPTAHWRPRLLSDGTDYAPSSSGTIARVEISIHTPAGPGATVSAHLYVDAFESL